MFIEKRKSKPNYNDLDNDGVNLYHNEEVESHLSNYDDKQNSKPHIKQLALRLFSLLNSKKLHTKNNFTKPNYVHNHILHEYQNSKLINYLENLRQSTQHDLEDNGQTSMYTTAITQTPVYILPSSEPTTSYYSSSFNDVNYKNNELYSIFVSMFTAALFVFFIMWRWLKMKSDVRKALREQFEIQQQQRLNSSRQSTPQTPPSTSTNISPSSLQHQNHFFSSSNYRENLSVLLNQLNDGEQRSNRQNQQIIDAAKYCLQQLRFQTRCRSTNRHLYSFNSRNDLNGQTMSYPIQPLIENFNSTSSIMNSFRSSSNEQPPSYDSIMKKSSSLPSYYHLTLK